MYYKQITIIIVISFIYLWTQLSMKIYCWMQVVYCLHCFSNNISDTRHHQNDLSSENYFLSDVNRNNCWTDRKTDLWDSPVKRNRFLIFDIFNQQIVSQFGIFSCLQINQSWCKTNHISVKTNTFLERSSGFSQQWNSFVSI